MLARAFFKIIYIENSLFLSKKIVKSKRIKCESAQSLFLYLKGLHLSYSEFLPKSKDNYSRLEFHLEVHLNSLNYSSIQRELPI